MFLILFATYSLAQDPCVINPTNTTCANYQPDPNLITGYTASMCNGMMADMPGCTVYRLCQAHSYSGDYCQPYSIYQDVCMQMPMMKNCSMYRTMCVTGSLVKICSTPTLDLPAENVIKANISDICSEMNMQPCADCTSTACSDPLTVYSELCLSMPDMPQCGPWNTLCKQIPDWTLCTYDSSSSDGHTNKIPPMRMYFHLSYMDYVLLQNWVPDTTTTYTLTWLAVFAFTLFFEVLKLMRSRYEKRWSDQVNEYSLVNSSGGNLLMGEAKFRPRVDFARAFLHTLEVAWGFLVMLVVMTYNVGLFLAVLAGSFLGMLFVGRFVQYVPKAGCH